MAVALSRVTASRIQVDDAGAPGVEPEVEFLRGGGLQCERKAGGGS